MEKTIINKILEDTINKCGSNADIQEKLDNMSQQEKDLRLNGKINPFEGQDYKDLLKELDIAKERLAKYKDTNIYYQSTKEKIESLEKKIFDYEKRIFRGYDLNKKIDKVPNYDIDDYMQDDVINETMEDVLKGKVTFGRLEQKQLDNQKNIDIDEEFEGYALWQYFGNDSLTINSVLDHKYGSVGEESNWEYWSHSPSFEGGYMTDYYSKHTKFKIKKIDSAINKCSGLLQPTILYHGVDNSNIVNIHTRVGDKINMKSFISTSFQEDLAKRYGKKLDTDNGTTNLYVRFLAPTGTKGISANDDRCSREDYFFEHEYLLGRGQSGTVVDINYETGCVTVLLE